MWRKEKAVAGEMRDSFRQAMSEMFMGGDSDDNKGQAPQGAKSGQGSASAAPDTTAADSGPATGRSTVIRHVEQNPAEAQLARMSQDMSGLQPEFAATKSTSPERRGQAAPAAPTAPVTQTAPASSVAPTVPVPARNTESAQAVPGNVVAEEAAEPQGPIRSSIIAEGTEITGEVKFGSDAEVYGTLNAKVISEDDILTNTGTITGDVVAKNLDMLNAEIKGDVATYGDLRLSDSSILTGDVAAMRMDLRGQLIGNSAVRREMNVHSTAKLAGDVEAGSLAVGHGAKVRGFVSVGFEEE